MAWLHRIRSSPAYLYIKCYLICTLVTLFAARPISSRLRPGGHWVWYESTEGGHGATSWGRMQQLLANATRRGDGAAESDAAPGATAAEAEAPSTPWWQERRFPYLFPPPQLPLNLPPPPRLTALPRLQRWRWRWSDLSQLAAQVDQDTQDTATYPELEWDAKVRCSPELHDDEVAFIAQRRRRISSEGNNALAHFLRLPEGTYVHPDDVPLIAIGGSGGGYRAMYAYAGFIKEAENTGLWQCTTWASGVSGSCWTIAALYTIASCSTDVLIAHLLAMAHEEAHPMSVQAMDRVARSQNGIYYLLGPLLRKSRGRSVACRLMDFYATLVLSYQYLPRPLALFGTDCSYHGPEAKRPETPVHESTEHGEYMPSEGMRRTSFQWSKVWERAKLHEAAAPLPILTGVRRVWRSRPQKGQTAPVSHEQPPAPHPAAVAQGTAPHADAYEARQLVGGGYDWYEISPLELGSRNVGAWIPTWSYGRRFKNGVSLKREPEVNLAMIVGQCTGAPAGPLTAYISTMLASIPEGTVMSTMLSWVNEFIKMKRWEKRWGNPIRAADEPNPFYGHGMDDRAISMPAASTPPSTARTQAEPRTRPTSIVDQPYSDPAAQAVATQPGPPLGDARLGGMLTSDGLDARPGNGERPAPPLFAPPLKELGAEVPRDAPRDVACDAPAVDATAAETASPAAAPKTASPEAPKTASPTAPAPETASPDKAAPDGTPDEVSPDAATPFNAFLTKLPHVQLPHMPKLPDIQMPAIPKLGDISVENPLRHRRGSDASITSSMSNYDPETFMAPLYDVPAPAAEGAAAPSAGGPAPRHEWSWEHSKRLRLMDSGLSNNLPNHVLAREERDADVLISFDSSSDVKLGAAVQRLHEFGEECGLQVEIQPATRAANEAAKRAGEENAAHAQQRKEQGIEHTPEAIQEEAERIRNEYEARLAQRFDGWRLRRGKPAGRDPDVRLVYCPLFPNAVQPGFDPSTAHYSTSYNLVWTADQVRALLRTAMANVEEGSRSIEVIRAAVRDAYEARRARRLARAALS